MGKVFICKKCNHEISLNTKKKLIFCICGKIGVDGNNSSSRIIGDKKYLKIVEKEDTKETYVYRIKQVSTGLYFKPYRYPYRAHFSKDGKFYSRKPVLRWANDISSSQCVIEKYKITVDRTF